LRASLPATPPEAAIDPGQCRETCAQPYYFCLASEAAASCPQSWSRCLTDCDRPDAEP
jgi:hypothetical protein